MAEPINLFGVFPSTVPRSTDSSSPMPLRPADLDAASLTAASGVQLNFWIDAANTASKTAGGKKVLVKTGNIEARHHRLADYYNIDLTNIPAAVTIGPDSAGIPFQLIAESADIQPSHQQLLPSIKFAIDEALTTSFQSSTSSENDTLGSMDTETIQALIQSAKEGDIGSVSTLFKLQAALRNEPPTIPNFSASLSTGGRLPLNLNLTSSSYSPSVPSSSTSTVAPPPLTSPIEPTTSLDSIILASGGMSVEALNRADSLREVIAQIENGDVAKIRKLYGPQKDRATNPMWATIKVTITRRERLGSELANEFNGDKEWFFTFFTFTPDPSMGKKRKSTEPVAKLHPLRRVVEAIPHRDKDLQMEQSLEEYQNDGVFSEDAWNTKWEGKNKWEIWREIGKEKY
ncbi:hypothetical protein DFH07DRAFT_785639 [Mycena maculata]|uniref:Uncharacterized protein n=1 Tax=Mycena maculata TaxID=230809 RepID=A0AAD7H8V7_9AGAR|nr:hypothetical protein DFH07DRAFT_785639 [Mycena maculata]